MKLLFVCLGNICRSPTAEAIFRKKLQEQQLSCHLDSAGTQGYHSGERSDSRSIRHASLKGYEMTHLARQVTANDIIEFDLILAMDRSNYENLLRMCPQENFKKKIFMVTTSSPHSEVPDPYYGSSEDFEKVISILEDCFPYWSEYIKKSARLANTGQN